MKPLVRDAYEAKMPSYYVESVGELSTIPPNAPAGTIAECNSSTDGFKVYMKTEAGAWNEL